jgi:serine phosphatase RsbU (regulator of sigma subunit)/anti-sigma regulatory factor (Ser/Thr protein kinase)
VAEHVDGEELPFFAALPVACVLLDDALVVREVTDAFLKLTGSARREVLGRRLDPAFPVDQVERVVREAPAGVTGRPLEWTDLSGTSGTVAPRRRRLTVTTVPGAAGADGDGRRVLLSVDDAPVRAGDAEPGVREGGRAREEELIERTQRLESDLESRVREVAELSRSEAQVARRLQGLAFVALELAAADSVEELTDLVVVRGVAAMGCDGGGVAVRDDEEQVVRLTITDTRREGQRLRQEMPMTTRLPSVVAAIVPEPIFLGNRDEGLAWGPEMELVYATSGCFAWASLPLIAEGRQLGSLTVSWVEPRTFTDDERELLLAFAAQCAQALQRIQAREVEREATMSSRLLSESLQRSLLTEPAQPPGMRIAVRYRPATREAYVGGDWYDAFPLPGEGTQLVIGDVAGHDRMATATMAQVRGLLRGVAHSLGGQPAEVLTGLDRAMSDLGVDAIVTAVLARVEPPAPGSGGAGLLRWSNAGHPPPVVLRRDGSSELLDTSPELLLGVQPSTGRTDQELRLEPGMTVLFYTDGLVERRGEALGVGLEWLRHRVSALVQLPLDALCDALLGELSAQAEDDVALLAIRTDADADLQAADVLPDDAALVEPRAAVAEREPARRRPDFSLVLPPDVSAVRRARTFVRHQCKAAGVPASVCDTVELLTSETVTNALIHGRSEARLRLVLRGDVVRVEVGDDNSRHPVRPERQDDALDGRGLAIVELLSSSWGVDDDVRGKVVWFEVPREA